MMQFVYLIIFNFVSPEKVGEKNVVEIIFLMEKLELIKHENNIYLFSNLFSIDDGHLYFYLIKPQLKLLTLSHVSNKNYVI